MTAKKVSAAKKGTAKKSGASVTKSTAYPGTLTARLRNRAPNFHCKFCGGGASAGSGGRCVTCNDQFEDFRDLVNFGSSTEDQMFKMYRDLRARIEELETALEVKRITEKYSS